jgi:hypothetical protein
VSVLRLLVEGDIERLIDNAKESMLLHGVNLHYVVNRHTKQLATAALERGVATQVYLLDHQSSLGKDFYSEEGHRDHLRDSKAATFGKLRDTQAALREMHRKLAASGRSDRLKVWLYKYISMYTMVAIDAETEGGRMIISPHLYSTDAQYPPLFELSRKENPEHFQVYWKDITQFVQRVEKRALPWDGD